ncbi:MAG TPA: hypothetical protein V6C64_12935 [Microcoleaceae cyanobacterium]
MTQVQTSTNIIVGYWQMHLQIGPNTSGVIHLSQHHTPRSSTKRLKP